MIKGIIIRFSLVLLASLILSALIHRIINIYFYVSFLMIPVTATIGYLVVRKVFSDRDLLQQEKNLLVGLFCISVSSTVFAFNSTIPLNVDRSFSVWMINQIHESPTAFTRGQLAEKAASFFSPDSNEIERRISEQVSLRNLRIETNQVLLTDAGKRVWFMNRIVSQIFGLNNKYSGS